MPKRKETPLRLAGFASDNVRLRTSLALAAVPPLQEGFVTRAASSALVGGSVQAVAAAAAAASSAALPPCCPPSAPLRDKVPVLQAYKRGSTKAALGIIRSAERRQEAVAALQRDVYAASAADPRQS